MSIAVSVNKQLNRRKGSLFLLFFSDLLFYLSKSSVQNSVYYFTFNSGQRIMRILNPNRILF